MMPEQEALLIEAKQSLDAAKLLLNQGYTGFSASRAYYTMFYIAEAFLLGKGLAFSKHSGVHAGFSEHFIQTGIVPQEFHRHLIRGMDLRHAGDYGRGKKIVTYEKAQEQLTHAEEFLNLAKRLIGPFSSDNHQANEL